VRRLGLRKCKEGKTYDEIRVQKFVPILISFLLLLVYNTYYL
jgi:hypothetical protein